MTEPPIDKGWAWMCVLGRCSAFFPLSFAVSKACSQVESCEPEGCTRFNSCMGETNREFWPQKQVTLCLLGHATLRMGILFWNFNYTYRTLGNKQPYSVTKTILENAQPEQKSLKHVTCTSSSSDMPCGPKRYLLELCLKNRVVQLLI